MKYITSLLFLVLFFSITSCKKEVDTPLDVLPDTHREEIHFGVTVLRNSVPDVAYYFVDGSPTSKSAYDAAQLLPFGYSHFLATAEPSEIRHECHRFTSKSSYCTWGDAQGLETTKELNKYEILMAEADTRGLPEGTTIPPQWYLDLYAEVEGSPLIHTPSDTPDAYCYSTYFWKGYEQCNLFEGCYVRIDIGGWFINRPYLSIGEPNTFSAWKGDVSTGCTGHKKAELKAYDRSFFRDLIGTITTSGDVFCPFLNIYAQYDNKIASFRSKSKN